jgi:hypothetical protein
VSAVNATIWRCCSTTNANSSSRLNEVRFSGSIIPNTVDPGDTERKPLINYYFYTVATGIHLKEYTITELNGLFRKVGFSKVRTYIRVKEVHMLSPVLPAILCERFLSMLPYMLRKRIACLSPIRWLLVVRLVATK